MDYPSAFDLDLIDKYVSNFVNRRRLTGELNREEILELSHLGKIESSGFVPNNACALMFAKDPRDLFPGCRVRFLRFDGEFETTGEKWNAVKDLWIDAGSAPRLIVATEKVLDAQIREFSSLGSDGIFYTAPEYPKEVWYEAVVNACVTALIVSGICRSSSRCSIIVWLLKVPAGSRHWLPLKTSMTCTNLVTRA